MKTAGSLSLRRALGLPLLVFFGLGTIVGAGIYVLVGEIARLAGVGAPVAFALAGGLAALVGLCYAELAVRFPEAAGAAAYVREGFGSDALSRLVGLAVAAVAVVGAASIARGAAGYIRFFVDVPTWAAAGATIVLFTLIACREVRESLSVAALMTAIEIGGLLLVVAAGVSATLESGPQPGATAGALPGISTLLGGAFVAFFAFMGFESLAMMAEESRETGRTLPRAILLSIALAGLLYVLVAGVAVLAVPVERLAASPRPLGDVIAAAGWRLETVLAGIAVVATVNGVLIEIVMLARLGYGMARRGWLPSWLARIHPRTRTPVRATAVAGGLILLFATALPFQTLVAATSTITLSVFLAVSLSLWRIKRRRPMPDLPFRAPGWVPPAAAASTVVLTAAAYLG